MAQARVPKEGPLFDSRLGEKLRGRDFIKHLWTHLPPVSNEALLRHSSLSRIIFLYRSNLFDVAVSTFMARSLRHWDRVESDKIDRPISVTPTQIKSFAGALKADILAQAALVGASGKPVAYVCYERLYSPAYRDQFLQVCRFLDLPHGDLTAVERLAPSAKYSDDDTFSRAIVNWREIRPLRDVPRLSVSLNAPDPTVAPHPTE